MKNVLIAFAFLTLVPISALAADPPVRLGLATDTVEAYKWAIQIDGANSSIESEWVQFDGLPFLAECKRKIGIDRTNQSLRGPIELAKANGTPITVTIFDTTDSQGGCFIQAVITR